MSAFTFSYCILFFFFQCLVVLSWRPALFSRRKEEAVHLEEEQGHVEGRETVDGMNCMREESIFYNNKKNVRNRIS